MILLSICDVVVLTIGTFGWWGAFFSEGQVIYGPNEFVTSDSVNKSIKGVNNTNSVCITDDFWVTKMKTTSRGFSIIPKLHSIISSTCNHLHRSNSVLWIGGAPGAGKSTITKRFQEYGFTVLDCEDNWAWGDRLKKLLDATNHALKTRTTVVFAACYEHFLTKSPDRVIPVLLLPSHSVYTERWKTRHPTDNQPHEARYATSIEVAKKKRVLVIKQAQKECVDKTVLRICTDSMIKNTTD